MLTSKILIDSQFSIARGKLGQYPSTFCYELRLIDEMERKTKDVGYLSRGFQKKLSTMLTSFDCFTSDIDHATEHEKHTTLLINLLKS